MIQTKTITTTTRTTITPGAAGNPALHQSNDSSTTTASSKLFKIIKHAGIGVFALTLSRIALYAPFSVQKTLVAISDSPDRQDEETTTNESNNSFQNQLRQFFDRPLMNKLVLYQTGHMVFTLLLSRQNLVPLSSFKPLEHAIISAGTFPLYFILLDQESRLVTKRGRNCEIVKCEDNTNYWTGYALHVAYSFLVHAAGLKISQVLLGDDNSNLGNVSDEAAVNHDSSDDRARQVLVESVGMLVGRLLFLPIEIYSKQLLLKSKPKKEHYLSTYVKSAILSLPQAATSLVEYWIYRTLNRCIQ